jgi:hypothetical protein
MGIQVGKGTVVIELPIVVDVTVGLTELEALIAKVEEAKRDVGL